MGGKDEILISVCCATYNHENYIKDALEGFLKQETSFGVEILIHEDASTDRTADIIREYQKKYPNRIDCVFQTENQFHKQNPFVDVMFKKAKGKYIALCEGDDYWTDPLKLQKQVDFLEQNQDYALTFHEVKVLTKEGVFLENHIKVPENHETILDLAEKGNYIHTLTVVYRNFMKDLPKEIYLSPIGDYFIYMYMAKFGKIKYFKEEMGVYRAGHGIHSSSDRIKLAKDNLKLFTTLLMCENSEEVKKVLFKRQLRHIETLEAAIRKQYSLKNKLKSMLKG